MLAAQQLLAVGAMLAPLAIGARLEQQQIYPRQAITNATTSFLPTATGTGAGHNCSWSWSSWTSASFQYHMSHSEQVNITTTYTTHNLTASTTVKCDNITRIIGDLTTTATGTTSSVISTYEYPSNYTEPPPTCTPPAKDCFDLLIWNPVTSRTIPLECARPTTSVQEICGPCGIVGGTIDLMYFPPKTTQAPTLCAKNATMSGTLCPLGPTTATNNATNPYDNSPCYYAVGTKTTENSGPYITSGSYTFYENRAYISISSAYATDRCGYVGEQHSGTIIEVASTDVYSIGGYHHYFADTGYSFNFNDLADPPSSAYYLNCNGGGGMACEPQQGTRYTPGVDFINDVNTVDLGANNFYAPNGTVANWIWSSAYAPIILMPTQIRSLDPAWSTCILDLGGLYDPPKALTMTDAVGPTAPGGGGTTTEPTTTAQPGSPGTTVPPPTTTPTTAAPPPTTTNVPAEPINEPTTSDDGGDDEPTSTPNTPTDPTTNSPIVQPTGDTTLNVPDPDPTNGGGDSNNGGGDSNGEGGSPTTTQDAAGIIASLIGGGGSSDNSAGTAAPVAQPDNNGDSSSGGSQADPAGSSGGNAGSASNGQQPDPSQPTGTIQNVGDAVASVLGMSPSPSGGSSDSSGSSPQGSSSGDSGSESSPSSESNGSGSESSGSDSSDSGSGAAPAPVVFTGSDATITASAVAGSSGVYVVDDGSSIATVTAATVGGSDGSSSSVEVVVGGQTLVAPAAASGSSAVDSGEDAGSGSETSATRTGSATGSGSGTSSDPAEQTGNFGSRVVLPGQLVAALGGAFLLAAL